MSQTGEKIVLKGYKRIDKCVKELRIMETLPKSSIFTQLRGIYSTPSWKFLAISPHADFDLFALSMGDKKYNLYDIALAISNAIKWIHNERIYHFDIKAENILCSVTESKIHFILSDFGASKSLIEETDDKFYGLCGTKGHIMPEALKVQGHYVSWGPRIDAFAFAVVILECFSSNKWFDEKWMNHDIDGDVLTATISKILGEDKFGVHSIPIKLTCCNAEFGKNLFRKIIEGYNRINFQEITDFINDYEDVKMLEYDKSAIMPSPATQVAYMKLNRRMANSAAINDDRTLCMRQQYHLRIFAQRIMALSQRGEITPGLSLIHI